MKTTREVKQRILDAIRRVPGLGRGYVESGCAGAVIAREFGFEPNAIYDNMGGGEPHPQHDALCAATGLTTEDLVSIWTENDGMFPSSSEATKARMLKWLDAVIEVDEEETS